MNEELEVYEAPPPANLFGADQPAEVVRRAAETATALAAALKGKGLSTKIGDRHHIHVEAWTMLGSMVGVFPIVVWTRELEQGGWEARAEARTLGGAIVGAAEAMCSRDETMWSDNPPKGKRRDDYALRAMAQTRAVSRAMRAPLGFIVQLAGYNPTPAEEMPPGGSESAQETGEVATQAQHRKLHALLKEAEESGVEPPGEYLGWDAYSSGYAHDTWGVTSRADLTKAQMSELIKHIDEVRIPFG